MSEQEFETYLALLGRLLRLSAAQRESIAGELRDHMQERLAELHEQGVPRDKAVRMALDEFGDAAALAAEFKIVTRTHRRRWMMRLTAGSFVAALALVMAALTMWPDSGSGPAPQTAHAQPADEAPTGSGRAAEKGPSEEESNAAAAARLDKRIDVEFVDTPLADVLGSLGKELDVQFYFDNRALNDIGIDSSAPVNLQLKQIRASMALQLSLEQLDLAYRLRDGIVVVTTPESAEADLEVRIYNCRDLLAFGPPATIAPAGGTAPMSTFGTGGTPGGLGGYGGFAPQGAAAPGFPGSREGFGGSADRGVFPTSGAPPQGAFGSGYAPGSAGEGAAATPGYPGGASGFGGAGAGAGLFPPSGSPPQGSAGGSPGATTPAGAPSPGAAPAGNAFGAVIPADVLAQFGGSGSEGSQQGGASSNIGGGRGSAMRRKTENDVFAQRAEQLMEIISGTIAPDSWESVGGAGTISEYSGLIVISQTQPIHDQVVRLLDMLRQSAAEAVAQERSGGKTAGRAVY